MKKKLLVLAVATALPMGAAQAGVTIYGKVHASIDYVDNDSYYVIPDVCAVPLDGHDVCPEVKIKGDDMWNVTSRASRIGFKGSEDLGNGLKLVWKMESQVDVASSGNTGSKDNYWKARNAYIGLAGGWGTFVYGRHDTPLKMSTGKLDLFSDELADYNATAGFVDRRADNAIAYISPSWGGLTLAGAIIPDGDYDQSGDFAGGWSIAAMYTLNSIYLAGAYEDITDLSTSEIDNKIWRIGAGWDIGNFFIGGVWENEDLGSSSNDLDKWQISGSYKFGNNKVKAMYADRDWDSDLEDLFDDDGSAWAIGWDYSFSKRSKMYAQYADSDHVLMNSNSGPDGTKGFSFGMVHSF